MSARAGRESLLERVNALLVAPGASGGESWLGYGAAVIGAAFGLIVGAVSGATPLQVTVLALLGFDLFGGAVVNATAAATRRFHGARASRRRQWGFVAAHVHLLGVALVFPGYPWATAVVQYSTILLAACVILLVDEPLRRPVAFAVGSVLFSLLPFVTATVVPVELAWIAPLLVTKLLLGHLVPWGPGARCSQAAGEGAR
ncbi:hypothetical protein AHOG_03225 [Actinoalloteichus hoggarensis]|uniref:Uncharacterized protein n=1 Tax=Actinoalloteichus hoggarensis TaxID=1470176 RepID=A0A221VXS9_9PSEU|nr:hypothetical protein AHOG_03225 [Actinoalloteichus hoggarensis]